MEMLFLGSVLTTVIVTNLAGDLFLKTCDPDDSKSASPGDVAQKPFSLAGLAGSLRMSALGEGLGEP